MSPRLLRSRGRTLEGDRDGEDSPRRSSRLRQPALDLPIRKKSSTVSSEKKKGRKKENKENTRGSSPVGRVTLAKRSLSIGAPETLVGREKEIKVMEDFLQSAWDGGRGKKRSLYVSGAPGTGKTASLMTLLDRARSEQGITVIFLNCMALGSSSSPAEIYSRVASALGHKEDANDTPKKFVEAKICKGSKKLLLVLDELDQLVDSRGHQEVLYSIFEWTQLRNSNLALIGIANSLDLTDRILPRLKLTSELSPVQLAFPAYTKNEIADILVSRLKSSIDPSTGEGLLKPVAVQFLAAKIAAVSGDVRKALDVCRHAIEVAEIEHRKKQCSPVLSDNSNTKGDPSDGIAQVDLPQVLAIFNQVYSSGVGASLSNTSKDDSSESLPLQQKLLLASLLLMCKANNKPIKEVTLGKLQETYTRVCQKRKIASVDLSEVASLCSLLETRGFFSLRKTARSMSIRDSKVGLRIDEKEVEAALKDKALLTDILTDVSCIAK